MKTLYLFNPENDMALAYGGPFYMLPSNVRKMASDLSTLPMWYAPRGAYAWVDGEHRVQWTDRSVPINLGVNAVTLPDDSFGKVVPWGWSASLKHRLQKEGLPSVCPSDGILEKIRVLSGRALAVEVLQSMLHLHPFHYAMCVTNEKQVDDILKAHPKVLLKAPWSGSGRGIRCVEKTMDIPTKGWMNRIVRSQGYVVAEPLYNKVADFAMEFYASSEGVSFAGYSVFETDSHGAYKENLLASDEYLQDLLTRWVSSETLVCICRNLEEELTRLMVPHYTGYLGVDMMVCRVEDAYAVHPCVEINLRMNMGMVSRKVFDLHVHPSSKGRFVIEYYPVIGEAFRIHQELQKQHPMVIEDNKLKEGYFSLTPVFQDTAYQAYVLLESQ